MQGSDLIIMRTLIQVVINGLGNPEVSWYGLARCFEKCADIARERAKKNGQLDTKYKVREWEDEWQAPMVIQPIN